MIGLLILLPGESQARKFSFIRDAEIEATLRAYANPLLRVAGLEPNAVQIFIVNDPGLNAFVAGGQNIFVNTGLLMKSTDASQIIGVVAHEIGHIEGGHLSRLVGAQKRAGKEALIGTILGGAAAILGNPAAGAAIAAGGAHIGTRNLLTFNRTQESAADQAALRYLEATGQSAKGLADFLGVLLDQELLSTANQDPYVRTHPLSRRRIDTINAHLSRSRYSNIPTSHDFKVRHARMKAKLSAFIQSPVQTFRQYRASDRSMEARYARAVAYYKRPQLEKALPLIDGLIAEFPNDPFFHELRGQMLFENGRAEEALPSYEQAARLLPNSALLLGDLGKVQLERGTTELISTAVGNLRAALDQEPRNGFYWRQLGIAYGKLGQTGQSSWALAEEALLRRKYADAIRLAERAKRALPVGSPDWIRAEDIVAAARQGRGKR